MGAEKQVPFNDPFSASGEPHAEFHISKWIEVVRRRRYLLYVMLALTLAIATLHYVVTPKAYLATTTIQIERRAPGPVKVEDIIGAETYWDAQSFYPTQFKLLESRGLAERVVKNLRLYEDPIFNPSRAKAADDEPATAVADQRVIAGLAGWLRAGVTIVPVRNTRLVQISYAAPTAELASRVANAYAEEFIDWGIEMRGISVNRASSSLSQQIEALKDEIADKEAQLQAYSRRSDIVALDPSSNVTLQRLEGLNRDYTAAMSERISREAQYSSLMNAPKEATADSLANGMVGQLRSELIRLEQEYASKLSTYKPEWPAMQDLKAKIDQARANFDSVVTETVEKAREAARVNYQTALRREQSLAGELSRQKGEAMTLNSAAVEYNNLKVEVETRRSLLDDLVRKQSQTEVASRMQANRDSNVTVVDRALVPGGPYRPSLQRNLMLGLALGLGLGLGLIFTVEYLDRTIKTPEDADRVLGLPLLGLIPDIQSGGGGERYGYYKAKRGRKRGDVSITERESEAAAELVCATHPRLAISESYRALRTSLLLSTADDLKSVLVTSATIGEGKTVTAGNLAVVLAQLGRQVVLLDADLRKPRQHEIFKVSNRTGIVSFLTGQADANDVFCRTGVANLHVAPAGPIPPNPAELLSSERMREFLALARARFDYVVIDSPPVLAVTDAAILSALADGVVVCLGAGKAPREDSVACKDRLDMVDARVLGIVLNRFKSEEGRYKRNYYAQYQAYVDGDSESKTRAVG